MMYTITRTKVILPRRHQDLLARRRLLRMLEDVLDYRLTLVAAPAGYGKTSLLVDLANQVNYPVCWLSLDELDRDPYRFLNHFVAAVQERFPRFGTPSLSLINSPGRSGLDSEQVLRTIVNDLYEHIEEHFALVLDDFHLVEDSSEVSQFVNRFAQEVDENCHLVVTSRTLLSLPDLPLMIGRSQVKGLSFEELAFEPEEIRELYQLRYHQELSGRDAEEIARETEGWITGLLLTAETSRQGLTEHGRAARAAGVDLYDYLAAQVLEQQPPEMREFLLRTSLLEEFNQELCQQALGEPPGNKSWGELIQDLLQANLFIQPVDNGGTWLRYQHLFQEFLQQHYRIIEPGDTERILRSLVDVYRQRGWWEKAYAACQQLGDEETLVDLVESTCSHLMHEGRIFTLKSWLDDLPERVIRENNYLLAFEVVISSIVGDPSHGLYLINQALNRKPEVDDIGIKALLLLRRSLCHRYLDNYQEGVMDAEKSLLLAQQNPTDQLLEAEAEREIALNKIHLGDNKLAKESLERALSIYLDEGDTRNAAFVEMDLGLLEMNQGNYDLSRKYYKEAFQIWDDLGNLSQLIGLCNNLGVLDHLTGNYRDAFGWFSRALEHARQTSSRRFEAFTLASLGDLALDLGALPAAESYYDKAGQLADELGESFLLNYLRLSRADLADKRDRPDEVTVRLEALKKYVVEQPGGLISGKYHLFRGRDAFKEGNFDRAGKHFQQAREIFENSNLPVESAAASLYLVRVGRAGKKRSSTAEDLARAGEIIQELGTVQPLVPYLAGEEGFLAVLEGQPPAGDFLDRLTRAVQDFQARLPELIDELGFQYYGEEGEPVPELEISALGRLKVKLLGEDLTAPEWTKQKTVRELFFYLLSQPEGASREEICRVFWPDSQPEQLNKQFKNALYRLRRAVGRDTVQYHQPTRLYHFDRSLDYSYDVEDFVDAVEQAESCQDPGEHLPALRRASELYRHPFGPSLEGIWAEPMRYSLYQDFERVCLTLARGELDRDQPQAALEVVETLLEVSPNQEAAWRLSMRAYSDLGDRSGIERAYLRCRDALSQALEVEPSDETNALYRALMA